MGKNSDVEEFIQFISEAVNDTGEMEEIFNVKEFRKFCINKINNLETTINNLIKALNMEII